jgi:hypothetical protein
VLEKTKRREQREKGERRVLSPYDTVYIGSNKATFQAYGIHGLIVKGGQKQFSMRHGYQR